MHHLSDFYQYFSCFNMNSPFSFLYRCVHMHTPPDAQINRWAVLTDSWTCDWACFVHRTLAWFGLKGTLKVIYFIIQRNTGKQDSSCSLSPCFMQLFIRSPSHAPWGRQVLLPFDGSLGLMWKGFFHIFFFLINFWSPVTVRTWLIIGVSTWSDFKDTLKTPKAGDFLWSIPNPMTVSQVGHVLYSPEILFI